MQLAFELQTCAHRRLVLSQLEDQDLCWQDITFYGLPDHPTFYSELVGRVVSAAPGDRAHATVTVLFTKFESLQLAQIVGSRRAAKMLKNRTTAFVIC